MNNQADTQSFDQFQQQFREREFCIGWHPCDSQKRTYYEALFDSWSEANGIAHGMQKDQPGMVFFVEAAPNSRKCTRCVHGMDEDGDQCGHCHGKGRVRA